MIFSPLNLRIVCHFIVKITSVNLCEKIFLTAATSFVSVFFNGKKIQSAAYAKNSQKLRHHTRRIERVKTAPLTSVEKKFWPETPAFGCDSTVKPEIFVCLNVHEHAIDSIG